LPELTDQLGPEELNLLRALHLDPLDLRVRLDAKLLGDALGIGTRLLGDALGLGLGLLQRLLVRLLGIGELLLRLGAFVQLPTYVVLLVRHHLADRWNDIAPHQKNDDCETDELTDECRHAATASKPM
jgi:hypothetical protein